MFAKALVASVATVMILTGGAPVAPVLGQEAPPQAQTPGMERPQGAMPGMDAESGRVGPMMMCQCPKAMRELPAAALGAIVGLGVLLLISAIAALMSLSIFLLRRSRLATPAVAR